MRFCIFIGTFLLAAAGHAQVPLDRVAATSGVRVDDKLFVTPDGGGIAVYPTFGGLPTDVIAPGARVLSMIASANAVCWIAEGNRAVFVLRAGSRKPDRIEVPFYVQRTAPIRLSAWNGGVMVHGEADFSFIDFATNMSRPATAVLPTKILKIARQGVVTSSWDGESGLIVSMRYYGPRNKVDNSREIRSIGIMTAWSVRKDGTDRLLGAYTCSLTDFREARGPKVEIENGPRSFERPFGTGPMGNIALGPEGVMGLANDEAVVVPFYLDNWVPSTLPTAFRPGYAQNATYVGSNAWWTDGTRAYRVDLNNGSGEAYVTKSGAKARAVVADDEGAFVLTDSGVRDVRLESPSAEFAVIAADPDSEPKSLEQTRLKDVVGRVRRGTFMPDGSRPTVQSILKYSGMSKEGERPVDEAEMGDVIASGTDREIYIGNGEVLADTPGGIRVEPFEPTGDARILRVLATSPIPPPPAPAKPTPGKPTQPGTIRPTTPRYPNDPWSNPSVPQIQVPDLPATFGSIFPIGVNSPRPYLGTNLYVRALTESPYDRPHLPLHNRLLQIAKSWIGTPYRWGGNTKDGVDCSGFVRGVYMELGIRLPRHSQDMGQVRFGTVVRDQIRFGDILVYQRPKHVALYIGGGRTIEAIRGGVGYSTIYRRTQAIVRRFIL